MSQKQIKTNSKLEKVEEAFSCFALKSQESSGAEVAEMVKAAKEGEDLAAIQAKLQLDRAKLANEISTRLGCISPNKKLNGSTNRNPFSMPSNGSSSSSSLVSSSSTSLFSQRSATLGLGAEPSDQDRKQVMNGVDNVRLKGALVGKRKREMADELSFQNNDDDEDSKSSVVKKGKRKEVYINGGGKTNGKLDPFAPKKSKGKSKEDAIAPKVTPSSTANEQSQKSDLASLSKAARKRLKKKMKREAERKGERNGERDSSPVEEIEMSASFQQVPINKSMKAPEQENGMTTHQKSLLSHLSGARFRQINETLYTTTSSSALAYIQGEPLKLQEYHEGFREQVKSWPKVPVRQIAEMLLKGQTEKTKQKSGRFAPGALVVDLGAGEAILARLLAKDGSAIRVLSYDLLDSDDGWVKGLDIAKLNGLPLTGTLTGGNEDEQSRIVDVAVFCLSLMGTNWVEMIMEASRVLRKDGELIIAEVTSRFNTKEDFVEIVSSLGFKLRHEVSPK